MITNSNGREHHGGNVVFLDGDVLLVFEVFCDTVEDIVEKDAQGGQKHEGPQYPAGNRQRNARSSYGFINQGLNKLLSLTISTTGKRWWCSTYLNKDK